MIHFIVAAGALMPNGKTKTFPGIPFFALPKPVAQVSRDLQNQDGLGFVDLTLTNAGLFCKLACHSFHDIAQPGFATGLCCLESAT